MIVAPSFRAIGFLESIVQLVPFAKRARAERGIWQRRFWEHRIRDDADDADDARHVEYGHINPPKHGLVERVRDWPYSSLHRDVGAGVFPVDRGSDIEAIGGLVRR